MLVPDADEVAVDDAPPPGAQGLGKGWVFSALVEEAVVDEVLVEEVAAVVEAEEEELRLAKGFEGPKPSWAAFIMGS